MSDTFSAGSKDEGIRAATPKVPGPQFSPPEPGDRTYQEEVIDDLTLLLEEADEAPSGREILYQCMGIAEMLIGKNRKYGNSAIEPVRCFSKAGPVEQINVRLDDKISRLMSAQPDDTEDVELDLVGYIVLKRIAQNREKEDAVRRAAKAATNGI